MNVSFAVADASFQSFDNGGPNNLVSPGERVLADGEADLGKRKDYK